MPTALATIRGRLQTVLDDAAAAVWTTAELDQHIQDALRNLSHRIPRERTTTIATTAGSRDVALTTVTERVRIIAVEWPTGSDPKSFVDFSVWGDTLRIESAAVPDGSDCIVYWQSLHSINGTDTLPEDYDDALVHAAAARACDQQAADLTNTLPTGGSGSTSAWRGAPPPPPPPPPPRAAAPAASASTPPPSPPPPRTPTPDRSPMRSISGALAAAQKAAGRRPYLLVSVSDRHAGIRPLRSAQWYAP